MITKVAGPLCQREGWVSLVQGTRCWVRILNLFLETCGRPSLGSEYIPAPNSVSHCDIDIFAQLDRIGLFMGLEACAFKEIYFFRQNTIMYNSVRVLGRVRGSVVARRALPNAFAATRFINFQIFSVLLLISAVAATRSQTFHVSILKLLPWYLGII